MAQLYVGLPGAKLSPGQGTERFSKVFLKAGESKPVIKFDDKTFRYWNMKTNTGK
ncbi:MAG: hypothetical protein ACLRMZ_11065 [Blautia marasmi]